MIYAAQSEVGRTNMSGYSRSPFPFRPVFSLWPYVFIAIAFGGLLYRVMTVR